MKNIINLVFLDYSQLIIKNSKILKLNIILKRDNIIKYYIKYIVIVVVKLQL